MYFYGNFCATGEVTGQLPTVALMLKLSLTIPHFMQSYPKDEGPVFCLSGKEQIKV